MKIFKKILISLLILLTITAIICFVYSRYQQPQYAGELVLKNIQKPAEVYFDDYGIPHIFAENQHDVMVALGYVHAQDRLWQMELLRRIAPGRLSEIFGTRALKNDMFFAGLGIEEASTKAIKKLDKNSAPYLMAIAYLDGINQYLENGKTPIEFTILGIQKQKFTLQDVYNTFGFMAFSFAMAQKTDPLFTDIRIRLGTKYLEDLGVNYEFNTTKLQITKSQMQEYAGISKSIADLVDNFPAPPFVGSNSWVIGSTKTKSGKVIFANDPHIEFSQPGTWYEAHVSCPDYEIYGFYVAGTPFPLLGHNHKIAYGLTMFENDDADFFEETINPKNQKQYLNNNKTLDFINTEKVINVKDSALVKIKIKSTIHGPIINNLLADFKSKKPVSLSWIYTQQPINILDVTYGMSHSKDIKMFEKSISTLAAPGLNVMYGDAENNIAWFTTGKLYKLEKNVNPNFILNGSTGVDDKKTFFDFKENPKSINPASGFVYSSNNMPTAIDGYDYPGYYLPADRANRISLLLENKNNWDIASSEKMITDNISFSAPTVVKNIISEIPNIGLSANENQALAILKKWTGSSNLQDVAPTIYNKLIYFYLQNTFEDELGAIPFNQFLKTHIVKQVIEPQSKNQKSVWWDNILTNAKTETKQEICFKSFRHAISSLEKQLGKDIKKWTWSHVHQLEIKHPLGSVAVLKPLFNGGLHKISGANEVINNNMFLYSDDARHTIKAGPSTRRIIDFSDIENSTTVLPTGNSGNPFNKHYNDQNKLFCEGKFRKMILSKKYIVSKYPKLLVFSKK